MPIGLKNQPHAALFARLPVPAAANCGNRERLHFGFAESGGKPAGKRQNANSRAFLFDG
jgi:hypothetical protein